jgi:cell wall-associated NlpC family hydrolase
MNPINKSLLISLSAQLERRGVKYGYGAKADDKQTNPRSTGQLSTPPDTIDQIDCSGFSRYILYQTAGWRIPDGSQNQREWCENNQLVKLATYADVNDDVGGEALYIAFIKPYTNGCGSIGHVWFVYKPGDGQGAETFESHGGVGVDSRKWDTTILLKEAFEAFKLP